jgi:integrase/recombinase XerD
MDNMLANENNSIRLENVEVYEEILHFIERSSKNSVRTGEAYKKGLSKFFLEIKSKELEFLNKKDICLTLRDFENFQRLRKAKGDSGKTINQATTAAKELLKYVVGTGFLKHDLSFLMLFKGEREEPNEYGVISLEQFKEMIRQIDIMPRVRDREMKKALFNFCAETLARQNECLSLKWSNVKPNEDGTATVKLVGKGNKYYEREIPKTLYSQLLDIKAEGKEKVFNISPNAVSDLMIKLRETMCIPDEDNVVFHSIRKMAAMQTYIFTNDLDYVRRLLNHSNLKTTQIYLGIQDHGLTGIISMQEKISDNLYQCATDEELYKAIEKLPMSFRMKLNYELDKIMN